MQGWAGSYASTTEEISTNEVKKGGEQRNEHQQRGVRVKRLGFDDAASSPLESRKKGRGKQKRTWRWRHRRNSPSKRQSWQGVG